MQPTRLPRKKDVALELLEHATVFVHLDPRAEPVRVPAWFKRQPQLVLQIGLNMAVPIPDLQVDDEGLSCTLSFNRAPFLCVIPWSSVFALVDDRRQGMVWPDDVPPELNQQAQQQPKPVAARAELKIAPAPAKEEGATEATAAKPAPKRRARKTAAAKAEPRVTAAAKPARAVKPRASAKAAAAKRAPVPEKAAVPKAAPAPAQAPAAAAGGASKRKLPPYLRVVK